METMVLPPKPPTDLEQQVALLEARGLHISNEKEAARTLNSINYYRLRGYYIHLQDETSDDFHRGTSFEQILALHDFDSELRLLVLSLLLDIEIVARARIAYCVGHAWGAMGYREQTNYSCKTEQFDSLMKRLDDDLAQSRERFIKTHHEKYGGMFPIWVAVEVMSFGDLSKLYSLLPVGIKKNIANSYDYLDESLLTNWIHAATVLRNVCAHNGRIYNRSIPTPIIIENKTQTYLTNALGKFTVYPQTLFAYLLAFRRISDVDSWKRFYEQLTKLFVKYDGIIEINRMGFPYQWKTILY